MLQTKHADTIKAYAKEANIPLRQAMDEFYRSRLSSAKAPVTTLEEAYERWKIECNARFGQLKANEEELNRIFIDIYGLQDELTKDVEPKDVTVHYVVDSKESAPDGMDKSNYLLTKQDMVKSLISYAVGCMFGRYSLDKEGLQYAGGEWDISKYHTFVPDKDAIIPITDDKYFDDDIVALFIAWLQKVYGDTSLEQNLDFIANALGGSGNTSREVIRNYFLKDFYKDHCKTYQKRPIYWLFDSGKQNGFKCLVYMHRYHKDMVGVIRSDYLSKTQAAIENALRNAEYIIQSSTNSVDKADAVKRKDRYLKQLAEIKAYYPALAHVALQRIELDLDDGVKVNYGKFQGIEVSNAGEKKQTIDLLSKI